MLLPPAYASTLSYSTMIKCVGLCGLSVWVLYNRDITLRTLDASPHDTVGEHNSSEGVLGTSVGTDCRMYNVFMGLKEDGAD